MVLWSGLILYIVSPHKGLTQENCVKLLKELSANESEDSLISDSDKEFFPRQLSSDSNSDSGDNIEFKSLFLLVIPS